MSVLSFPRIYFRGVMCFDPPTGNNNDQFPTYAYDQASLNWAFLANYNIKPDNFQSTFGPWVCSNQAYINQSTMQCAQSPPGEWNYFGSNACYFVQYEDISRGIIRKSLVTGGALALGKPATQDPLFGKPIELIGDVFGSPEASRPGRLVDNNPACDYSSQIYFHSMRFGDDRTGISGPCYRRMHSRFIGPVRNPNLPSAGHASVTWQTCFPADKGLVIANAGNSPLLAALQQMIAAGKARGVMVRFNTYLALYYQNGYFNDISPRPKDLGDLPALYAKALADGNQFANPCYTRVVGTIGPWFAEELVSVPQGRFLATAGVRPVPKLDPQQPPIALNELGIHAGPQLTSAQAPAVAGANINIPPPNSIGVVQFGITLAEIDYTNHVISLDVMNTFPEWYWDGAKYDLGDATLGATDSRGNFTRVATIPYADYAEAMYEQAGGTLDIKFDPGLAQTIADGVLVCRVASGDPKGGTVDMLVEQPFMAQTDDRGIYLNEGEKTSFNVSVFYKGKPAPNVKLLVAQYAPALDPRNPMSYVNAAVTVLPTYLPQIIDITNGRTSVVPISTGTQTIETNVTVVDADAHGVARIDISAVSAGLPVLVFYPFAAADESLPQPIYALEAPTPSAVLYFTTIRVLSFDDDFVERFVTLWNSTFDAAKAWNFVYENILYLYDMLFPVMRQYVPLGDRQRVEGAVDQVLTLIAPSYFAESTLAMPITRDLSRGKRTVLQLWGGLVKKNYPPQPISKPAPPVA
jgi:hypothetical protein